MSMNLPRVGREYARWTVDTDDTLTGFEVQLVAGGEWHTADYTDKQVRLLVFGPDYPNPDQGVLVAAACRPTVRCTDNPETVIRQGGWIVLV